MVLYYNNLMITTSDKYLIINADDFGYCDDRD